MSTISDEAAPSLATAEVITLDEVASAGRTALYRLYNSAGEVIYIGISDDPIGRMGDHAREQPWWHEVADKTAVWYQTRVAAEVAETIAIGLEQPKYNKAKRYVRLPEQAFPEALERVKAPSGAKRVRAKAPEPPAPRCDDDYYLASGHLEVTAPPELKARVRDEWLAERDEWSDVPNNWDQSMWCKVWFEAYETQAFRDILSLMGCERSDGISTLRRRVRHADDYPYKTFACFHPGNPRGYRGAVLYEAPWTAHAIWVKSPAATMQDTQRRFLYALQRAGRCAEIQLGRHAWAAGIGSPDEAQAIGVILAEIGRGGRGRLPEVEVAIAAIRASRMRQETFGCPVCGAHGHDDPSRTPACPSCRISMVMLVDRWTPRAPELCPPHYDITWEFPPAAKPTAKAVAGLAARPPKRPY